MFIWGVSEMWNGIRLNVTSKTEEEICLFMLTLTSVEMILVSLLLVIYMLSGSPVSWIDSTKFYVRIQFC